MLKLIYCDKQKEYPVKFEYIGEHHIKIIGEFPIEGGGFFLSREKHNDNWDYRNFKTVFQKIEGGAIFSNDGSIYIPPKPQEEPEPVMPTEEELEEERKQLQIAEIAAEIEGIDLWFKNHDYIGIKIATGRGNLEEYQREIEKMRTKASEKEKLETSLKKILEKK